MTILMWQKVSDETHVHIVIPPDSSSLYHNLLLFSLNCRHECGNWIFQNYYAISGLFCNPDIYQHDQTNLYTRQMCSTIPLRRIFFVSDLGSHDSGRNEEILGLPFLTWIIKQPMVKMYSAMFLFLALPPPKKLPHNQFALYILHLISHSWAFYTALCM